MLLFSANVTNPIEPVRRTRTPLPGPMGCVRPYDPALAAVGAGTAGYYAKRNSQKAIAEYRPVFEGHLAFESKLGREPVFPTLEDFVERSSALIGSPQQIIERRRRYHDQSVHSVMHLHADAGGLTQSSTVNRSSFSKVTSPPSSAWRYLTHPGRGSQSGPGDHFLNGAAI